MNLRLSQTMIISLVVLLSVLIGVPLGLMAYEAHRTGEPFGEYLRRTLSKTSKKSTTNFASSPQKLAFGPKIEFLKKIGMDFPEVIDVVKDYQ